VSYFFTSESVAPGHPDKVCDLISDSILDAALKDDADAKVAIEALVVKGFVQIAGQMSTSTYLNVDKITRKSIKKSGFSNADFKFDANTCGINVAIDEQSKDISANVFKDGKNQGAGDQGIMFGYACDETKEHMPLSIALAHALSSRQHEVFNNQSESKLGPDAKTQVTVQYSDEGVVEKVDKILVATQHAKSYSLAELRADVLREVVEPACAQFGYDMPDKENILINPSGPFVLGGPVADTGLTGRKIIVDTYGGAAHHGGGAFSGKDPSKVDRSAAYILRQAAKSVVACGLATKCELQVSYALGVAAPTSVFINTFGTGDDRKIEKIIKEKFDLRPAAIIESLDLKKPIYTATTNFGHFGKPELPWEQVVQL